MGLSWSDLNPVNLVGDVVSGAKKATGIGNVPQQPGVGGPYDPSKNGGVPASHRLVQDPTTGMFFDPATGTSYTDGTGTTPVTNPNLAQQVAQNYATSRQFLDKLGTYADQQKQAYAGQQKLAGNYQDVINGTAPSVAGAQLQQGLDQIQGQQLGMATAAGGNNAAAAFRNAANNMAGAGLQVDQQQAELRAKESADARSGLAADLGNEQSGAANMYQTNTSGAATYAGEAGKDESQQQGLTEHGQESNSSTSAQIVGGLAKSGGDATAIAASDRRVKHDVHPDDDERVRDFLDTLGGFGFKYDGSSKPKHGVIAQNLEHSDIGRDIVDETSGGVKGIRIADGLSVALETIGNLHRRIKQLEGGKRG